MRSHLQDRGLIFTFMISLTLIIILFHSHLSHLNHTYFSSSGDGLKGYYCAKYHTTYDKDLLSFKGMNYPYSENIIYTDSQPLISNTILFLKPIIDLSAYTVGIINFFMLLNFIITAVVFYLLFKRLKIPPMIAVTCAIAITYLSPQVLRMGGHFSLSYSFIMALFFYLTLILLQSEKKFDIKTSVYIAFLLFFSLFVHPYFFAMGAIIFLFAILFKTIFIVKNTNYKNAFKYLLIQIIIPYVLYSLFLKSTDPYLSERTNYPWGFWFFQSNTTGVFFPFGKPYEFIFKAFIKPREVSWEGVAYIGGGTILAIITGLSIIGYGIAKKRKKPTNYFNFLKSDNNYLFVLIFAGIVGLFLSFGLPFKLDKSHELVKHFSVFKQLRAIGRFNWVFFYSINIFSVIFISQLLNSKKLYLKILSFLMIFLFVTDAYYNIKNIPEATLNKAELFDTKSPESTKDFGDISSDFQAIITLPFFHVGSENYKAIPKNDMFYRASSLSIQTGLPMLSSMLSRTPIHNTLSTFEKFRIPSQKINTDGLTKNDFIILANKEMITNNFEKFMYRNGEKISQSDNFELLRLKGDFFEHAFEKYQSQLKKENPQLSELIYNTDFENCHQKIQQINNCSLNISTDSIEGNSSLYFWMSNIDTDLIGRTAIEISQEKENENIGYEYISLDDHLISIHNNFGLFKFDYYQNANCNTSFKFINRDISTHPEVCIVKTKILLNE